MPESLPKHSSSEEFRKFSQTLASPVVQVTVAQSCQFYIHSDLLTLESERFSKSLHGEFKEAKEQAITLSEEDPDLFGFFIEWLYRDRSILSRAVEHHSHYVTLARLYALGERLVARNFQSYCLWRFTESLTTNSPMSDECVCKLLRIACLDVTERSREDPLRAQIFWYGSMKLANLQKVDKFRQLLCDIPDLGKHLCLSTQKNQPKKPIMPNDLLHKRFVPESEYPLDSVDREKKPQENGGG